MLKLSYKNSGVKFDVFLRRNGSFFPSKTRRWEPKLLKNMINSVILYISNRAVIEDLDYDITGATSLSLIGNKHL